MFKFGLLEQRQMQLCPACLYLVYGHRSLAFSPSNHSYIQPGIATETAFARTLLQQRHEADQPVAPPLALCKYFMQMPAPASSLSATKRLGSSSTPQPHSRHVHLSYLHFRWRSIYTEMKLICVYNMKLAGRMPAH